MRGPVSWHYDAEDAEVFRPAGDGERFARVIASVHDRASGPLIAAAPDLLAALQTLRIFGCMCAINEEGQGKCEGCAAAAAAIARAEGRSTP